MSYLVLFCYRVFSVLLALRLPRLGKRELILMLSVRLFDLRLFGFVCLLFLLVSGRGCGLCGTPWTFLLPFSGIMDWSAHCSIISSNPLTACRMFEHKVINFINSVILFPANLTGSTRDILQNRISVQMLAYLSILL